MGASNTNGYGLRGYITDEELSLIFSGAVSKDDVNVYGYQRAPESAYPDLIRDHFVNTYGADKVTIDQLAISSMRVEELRVLLDNTYDGDDYTSWRFTGSDGWFKSAEEGGLEALRSTYKEKVTNADLITVDIGWNNFGVYVSNQLMNYLTEGRYMWTTDVTTIFSTATEDAAALEAKEIIRGYVEANMGEGPVADAITDIFAYSVIGYMHNFDIVMEKIYEYNPDVDVVTIGIQNLLHGVVLEIDDQPIPLGDLFGNFVDMANYYISTCSPYQDKYLYVKAGTDEHVTTFLDYIKDYDGNVKDLNINVKDCFDYYDSNINIQPMLDQYAATLLFEEPTYRLAFAILGYENGEDIVKDGKAGSLPTEFSFLGESVNIQEEFDNLYWPALDAAYDTIAVMCREIAKLPSLDATDLFNGTFDVETAENVLMDAVMNEVVENAMAAAEGDDYVVDVDKLMPDDATTLVVALNVRFFLGNSFFAHPNETGHAEIKNAVIQVLNNPSGEKDQGLRDDLADSVEEIHQLLSDNASA